MKKILYIMAILICNYSYCQTNLVPNPSFETYTACTHPLMPKISNWFAYSTGSPDAFNTCINPTYSIMGVPSNGFGYEIPHTGNGYCGFATYEYGFQDIQEFIRVKLNSTLLAGKSYSLLFYVSLSESSSYETTMFNAYFSSTDDVITDDSILMSNAQITVSVPHGLISKNGWTSVSATFTANGTEDYLMLGNFQKNNQVDTLFLCNCEFSKFSYYYIDDVSLYDVDELSSISKYELDIMQKRTTFKNGEVFYVESAERLNIKIYSQMGDLLLTKNESFYFENMAAGIYYYRIQSNKSIIQGKLIIIN